ncbi:MAG TPA: hypothetical protein P5110_09780 [Candidatus Omnitrophota bacterium]|nr:hypothetical protein [Candidatus Omnitrophota bacterium]
MSQEIEKVQSGALMQAEGVQRGFEGGVDREDLIIPRAKLIQALSPELTEGLEGIKVGSIINSLTKEVLPGEFIPVFTFKNYIRFNPRSKDDPNFNPDFDPGAVIWKSTDPLDPKVKEEARFGPNGEKPLATTFINFFSYFPGVPMPIIVSFSKTSYRAGKNLLSLAKFCGGDMFSRRYKLVSQMETNDIATYAVLKVTPAGDAKPEEYAVGERLWKDFASKVDAIQVHEEDAQDDAGEKRPY